ncbi:hypothetical protein A7X12_01330 [Sphingomonas sp. TDK1]|nr:hypothetical protein A7X12_01330 [Sphingomonas sp. TDK1]
MLSFPAARAFARRNSVHARAPLPTGLPPFIGWLRRIRRSAWRLIALCLVLRVGAALMPDAPLGHAETAAAAEQTR